MIVALRHPSHGVPEHGHQRHHTRSETENGGVNSTHAPRHERGIAADRHIKNPGVRYRWWAPTGAIILRQGGQPGRFPCLVTGFRSPVASTPGAPV